MAGRSDVELLIRARDEASQTLNKIAEETDEFVKANTRAEKSVEESDGTLQQLRAEYQKLQETLSGLKNADQAAQQFERSAQASREAKQQLREATQAFEENRRAQREAASEAQRSQQAYDESAAAVQRLEEDLKSLRSQQRALEGAEGQIQNLEQQRRKLADVRAERRRVNDEIRKAIPIRDRLKAQLDSVAASQGENSKQARSLRKTYNELDREIQRNIKQGTKLKTQQQQVQESVAGTAAELRQYGLASEDADQADRKRRASILQIEKSLESQNEALEKAQADRRANGDAAREATKTESQYADAVERSRRAVSQASARQQEKAAEQRRAADSAREAGVATDKAAGSQDRIQQEYEQTAQDAKQAKEQLDRYSNAAKRAGRASQQAGSGAGRAAQGVDLFDNNSRQAMDTVQRLRGELLALVGAWVGVQGIIEQTRQSFRAFLELEAAEARFEVLEGGQRRIADEMRFVRQTATRLGQEIGSLRQQYSKFSVVAQQTGLNTAKTRTIFEGLAEASTVMKLSVDETKGALKAFEQILSKGKVQAEELRNQLGDRFPGAVGIMARALDVSKEELNELLEQGEVSSDALLDFALQLKEEYNDSLPNAVKTFRSEINRLGNAATLLREDFGEVAAESLIGPITELTQILRSDEAARGAREMGRALGSLAEFALDAAGYLDEMLLVLKLIAAFKAVQLFKSMATGLWGFATAARGANAAVATLHGTLAVLFAAVAGFQIGSFLREEFEGLKKFGIVLIALFEKAKIQVTHLWNTLWLQVRQQWLDFAVFIEEKITEFKNNIVETVADILESLGFEGAAEKTRENLSEFESANEQALARVEKRLDKFQKRRDEKLAAVDRRAETMFGRIGLEFENEDQEPGADAAERRRKALERAAERRQERVQEVIANREAARRRQQQEQAGDERVELKEDVAERLAEIEKNIAEDSATTLQDQFDLIRGRFSELVADLEKLGDTEGLAIVEKRINQLKSQAREDFNQDRLTDAEEDLNDTISLRETLIENVNKQRENGIISAERAKERLIEIDERLLGNIKDQARAAKELAREMGNKEMVANIDNLILGLDKAEDKTLSAAEANDKLATGVSRVGSTASKELGKAIGGAQSFGDAIEATARSFLQFAAQFLREITAMILKQQILNALQSSGGGGGIGSFFAGVVNSAHEGAVVGAAGEAWGSGQRMIDPAWFANARRFHEGGKAGIQNDEVPAILQTGERVLSREENRAFERGGQGGQGGAGGGQNIRIINSLDPRIAKDFIQSGEGERTVLNVIERNQERIKKVIK